MGENWSVWRMETRAILGFDYIVLSTQKKTEQMGCLCQMKFAAGVVWKDCWVYEQKGTSGENGLGWPIELNGSELNHGTS